jgi:CheY-like chemotaxis protein
MTTRNVDGPSPLPVVLVAEDDPAIRLLVTRVLQRAGYATEEAADGQEAIDKIRAKRISVIVLDLMMPRVSGFDVLAFLKAHMPGRKCVIVLSAAAQHLIDGLDDDLIYARFRKPFEIDAIVDTVRQCVGA